MIFRRILSSILGLIVIIASLYMIEAASYRLVEPYAKFRLNLSWGDYLDSEINPYLSKFPLDHFLQPVSSSHLLTSNEVLKRELDYSKKILGYHYRDSWENWFLFAMIFQACLTFGLMLILRVRLEKSVDARTDHFPDSWEIPVQAFLTVGKSVEGIS